MEIYIGERMGVYGADEDIEVKIERLEAFIRKANAQALEVSKTGQGHLIVEDDVYDQLVAELTERSPESPILKELWDTEDITDVIEDELGSYYLKTIPMKSINTIKSLESKPYQNFLSLLPQDEVFNIILESKMNGYGIRVVWNYGDFHGAYSRARGTNGRDLTHVLHTILEKYGLLHIEEFEESEITEVRGELVMNSMFFEANRQVINTVSPLFAVASLAKPSATPEESVLLDFIPYRLYMGEEGFIEWDSRSEELETLQSIFTQVKLPYQNEIEVTAEDLANEDYVLSLTEWFDDQVRQFEISTNFGYYTDGIVMEVDDRETFKAMGEDIKYDYGNVALKIGSHNQSAYSGVVQMIRWTAGKSKITPVAIVSENPDDILFEWEGEYYQGYDALDEVLDCENYVGDIWDLVVNENELGVMTQNGSSVKRVPLYEPAYIMYLNLTIGSTINFNFGGEAGVIPVTPDGKTLVSLT